jgi:stage V sporulation protein SpoVS
VDLLKWILFGVLPASAAVLLCVGAGGPRFLALALGVALGVPLALAHGWPGWPWALSLQHGEPFAWLFWLVVATAVVGTCYDTRILWKPVLLAIDIVVVLAMPWLLSAPLRAQWSTLHQIAWLSAAWLVLALVWWTWRRVAKAWPGIALPLASALVLAADAFVLRERRAAEVWELAGVAAGALAMAVATAAWRRPFRCGTGAVLVVTVAHTGLLWMGRVEAELPRLPFLLACLAPLGLLVSLWRGFGRARGFAFGCGLVVTVATSVVAIVQAW